MKADQLPTRAEDMFCYGVYTASHMINQSYAPHLARLGLTYPQYITLTLLWDRDGQKVTELAKKLRMNTNTLTPMLKRLETLGHIKRVQGEADRRQILVHLTAQGVALKDKAPAITACMVRGTSLDEVELATLQALLNKLCDGLDARAG